MNKIWQIFFIVLFVFVVFSSLSYADDIDLEEAKKLSDSYLSYVLAQDYDQCYSMMDPITRKTVSRDDYRQQAFSMIDLLGITRNRRRSRFCLLALYCRRSYLWGIDGLPVNHRPL